MENTKKAVKITTDKKGNQKIKKADLEKAMKVKKLVVPAGSYDYRDLFKKHNGDYEQLMTNEMWRLTDEVYKLTGHIARLNVAMSLLVEKVCGKDLDGIINERQKKLQEQLNKVLPPETKNNGEKN